MCLAMRRSSKLNDCMIIGSGGQLGKALTLSFRGQNVATYDRYELDIRDRDAVIAAIRSCNPRFIINAAAMTNVDACEGDPDQAYAVNASGAENVSIGAAETGSKLVLISTNYVFDGSKTTAYMESDPVNPVNVYGQSKLSGERLCRAVVSDTWVVRTSSLYSAWKKNFVLTLLAAVKDGRHLRYVDDQFSGPTWVEDLSIGITELVKVAPPATYHLSNEGSASWYEWAVEVLSAMKIDYPKLDAVPSTSFQRPAAVPPNGVLMNNAAAKLGVELDGWKAALARFVGSL